MAETETNEVEETTENGGSGARTAVNAAAAAAATGAAAMAVRKLTSSNGKSTNGDRKSSGDEKSKGGTSSLLTSVASGGWDAARDAVIPLAEDAAGAAGTYLAKNAPEIVRDKIVPRFISSFNEARKED